MKDELTSFGGEWTTARPASDDYVLQGTDMSNIEITETDRGFHLYGDPVTTTCGHEVHVYESSAAKGPHCWLTIDPSETTRGTAAHLNVEQAIAIRDRLDAFIAEVPERWSHPETEGTNP